MKQQYIYTDDDMTKSDEGEFSFKNSLFRMFRMWPWFLLSLLVCLSLAYLYLSVTIPTYQAVSSLMVKDDTKGGELVDDRRLKELGLISSSKLVVNEIEILKSYDLMQFVVDSLRLFVSVRHDGILKDQPVFDNEVPFILEVFNSEKILARKKWSVVDSAGSLTLTAAGSGPVAINYDETYNVTGIKFRFLKNPLHDSLNSNTTEPSINTYLIDVFPRDATVLRFSANLLVEPANKLSSVINLELKDKSRKRATSVLRTLVYVYNQQGLDKRNREAINTINFINDRLITVARDLKDVENSVEKFKSENKLTKLSTDAEQYLNSARDVDAQKAQSQTQLNIVNALERDLLSNLENPQMIPSAFGIQDPSLDLLFQKYNDFLQQKVKIREKSGPQNPLLIDLETQIRELRSQLLANVRNLKQAYTISLNDITRKDQQLSSLIQNVPQLERQLLQITRSQNVQEQLYTYLLQKREEATVSQGSNIQDSETIVEARDLGEVAPKPNIIWAIGLFAGFLIPIGIFRVKDFLYNKVGDIRQVEEQANIPLLGIISHIKKMESSFVIHPHSRTAVAEQLRHLRTSVNYAVKGKDLKRILVTSFQPGDGKSFISLNLAACYALMRKKTVMLEFDLRKPHISADLNLHGTEGISTILSGKTTIDDQLIKVDGYEGYLYVLPAGNQLGNPAELILSDAMPQLMKKLSERFEYIIINTPPVGVVTDANLLQEYADITLIVLRQDHTSNIVYKELRSRIASQPNIPAYLVLNDVGKRKGYRNNYGYGSYSYELGKGYYTEKN